MKLALVLSPRSADGPAPIAVMPSALPGLTVAVMAPRRAMLSAAPAL